MRRCAIFRGSNTWRGLSTPSRQKPAANKFREAAGPIHGTNDHHGGIQRQIPGHLGDIEDSVQVAAHSVKLSPSQTIAEYPSSKKTAMPIALDPPSSSFPLSPLMDPEFHQAKERYSQMKQPPKELDTQLQQELAKNPFALALASPVRTCGLTHLSLPRYFLQDFKVVSHPTTDVPYFVPRSLTNKQKGLDKIGQANSIHGLTAYTLGNKHALGMMQDHRSGYFKGRGGKSQRVHHRLIPRSYFEVKPVNEKLMRSIWRPDMEHFVLELLRRRCVERLVDLVHLKRGYLVGCTDWEDAASKPSVGAFLWTGGVETDPKDPPTEFATLDLGMAGGLEGGRNKRKRKVPVYNLQTLLGHGKLAELREQSSSGIFTRDVVALKHKKMTVELQMHLWKMQGYAAEHTGIGRDTSENEEQIEDEEDEDDESNVSHGEDHRSRGEGRY